MKFNKKSNLEKIFIITISMFTMCFMMLCLCSCSGSCLGCSFNCESGEKYNLGGISYVSEGCCSSSSCKTAIGSIDTDEEDTIVSDMFIISCTNSSNGCFNNSSCSNGYFVGKDVNCGDCGISCTSGNNGDTTENVVGCIDGCIYCENTEGQISWVYEIIYYLLGI